MELPTQAELEADPPPTPHYITLNDAYGMGPRTLLTPRETARMLRISLRTLERWRSTDQGPPVTRVGPRRLAYSVGSILEFIGAAA